MWMLYWKEIAIGIVAMVLAGIIIGMSWKIDRQKIEIATLEKKVDKYESESKRLFEEYEKNIIKYNEKRIVTETVYRDKVVYIKESVDENSSCEDVIDSLNRYHY